MRTLLQAASKYARKMGFDPSEYRYAGVVTIGHISAGGEEYGYMSGQGGGLTPTLFDARVIHRLTWKRKIYYQVQNRELVLTVNGAAPTNVSKIVLVKDDIVLIELTVPSAASTYGDQRYTRIYLTEEVDLPIAGTVEVYIA